MKPLFGPASYMFLHRVECIDVGKEVPCCRGVQECGTSEFNRCSCGLRGIVVTAGPPANTWKYSKREGNQ